MSTKLAEPMMAAMEFTDSGIFVVVNGKRIARRGHPGTRHAKTWVPIEPGYVVRDVDDGNEIEIEFTGHKTRVQ